MDRALWAGFESDRLGFAFVGGYRAALSRLLAWGAETLGDAAPRPFPWPSIDARMSLAATESGGAHPRAIATTLREESGALVVRGEKTFATLASSSEAMLVVASRGADADGKNRLALVRVRTSAPGVVVADRPPTPFAPEIPHARVTLDDVVVASEDVLPGDGYDVYLKPFRTIEDTHVLAAALGLVVRSARAFGFDRVVAETACAQALSLRALAERAPSDPAGHVALAGLFQGARTLLTTHAGEWQKAGAAVAERWHRDAPLLVVADGARQKRTAAAWEILGSAT
ncbi:MAG: acyl-CoA dehydrogenase family protein [Labilithrix sp.]|nr:acyl-CoA dehydrogenase family protein [Labilithrix sp.]